MPTIQFRSFVTAPVLLAVVLIAAGAALNPVVIGYLYSPDGVITSSIFVRLIWAIDAVLIGFGVLVILGRNMQLVGLASPKLSGVLLIVLLTAILLNGLLYITTPLLPASLVNVYLSPEANLRYLNEHKAESPWVFEGYIRHAKPNADTGDGVVADSLGYRNPAGYLELNPNIDIVLLGDSFTWGTDSDVTIADAMRQELPGTAVYSLGMPGEAIPQWRGQYERFISTHGATPCLAVLNLFSGNDIFGTIAFAKLRKKGNVNPGNLLTGSGLTVAGSSIARFFTFNELVHIVKKVVILQTARTSGLHGASGPEDEIVIFREPHPSLFTDQVFVELEESVQAIVAKTTGVSVLLSYIPTTAVLYGLRLSNCPDCSNDRALQEQNSAILSKMAKRLAIDYIDVTPSLIAVAETEDIGTGHFNETGYALYANLLSKEIRGSYECIK